MADDKKGRNYRIVAGSRFKTQAQRAKQLKRIQSTKRGRSAARRVTAAGNRQVASGKLGGLATIGGNLLRKQTAWERKRREKAGLYSSVGFTSAKKERAAGLKKRPDISPLSTATRPKGSSAKKSIATQKRSIRGIFRRAAARGG